MCAIFGLISPASDADVRLDRMGRSLGHRGPDGAGEYHHDDLHLGMRRLAILDRQRGVQPFVSKDQSVQVFCNGEIYNFKELRSELEGMGYEFFSDCDCEILPSAWVAWGRGMLDRLNGMFALALYDRGQQTLFLARDRCGQKPLYYTHHQGEFIFASEVKGLLAAGVDAKPNTSALSRYLNLRYVPEPETFFSDVLTLPAGHWLEVNTQSMKSTLQRWWDVPTPDPFTGTPAQAVDELDRLTRSAVEMTLQSDEPIAAYLSAGVDSSLLAYYIKEAGGDVTTVSIGFGASSDESSQAAAFANQMGFSHSQVCASADDLAHLPRVVSQMERPVGDALIVAFDLLAARASSLGCKVAIGGEGADELFAGYSFQSAMMKADRLGGIGRNLASMAVAGMPSAMLNRFAQFPADMGNEGRQKIVQYLRGFGQFSDYRKGVELRTLFAVAECDALIHPDHRSSGSEPDFDFSGDLLDRHLRYQFREWLQDWAIIRQEKHTMAHSLEYRMPFLDHRLIEFAFSLPNRWKMHHGSDKWIWRELAARKLPDTITKRPKQPFYLPLEHYCDSPLFKDLVDGCLSDEVIAQRGIFSSSAVKRLKQRAGSGEFLPLKKIMALVILELWYREYCD